MFLIVSLRDLSIDCLFYRTFAILTRILKLILSLFLFLTYLTILCLITLFRFDIYILTKTFVLFIYLRNTFTYSLFISLSFLFSIRKDLKLI